jgi:hypothetical protein
VREFIADGTLFELAVIPNWPGIHLLKTPTGAFIVLAFFLAAINQSKIRKCRQSGMKYEPPEELSCRSCSICKMK